MQLDRIEDCPPQGVARAVRTLPGCGFLEQEGSSKHVDRDKTKVISICPWPACELQCVKLLVFVGRGRFPGALRP